MIFIDKKCMIKIYDYFSQKGRLLLTGFREVGGGRLDPDYHKKYFASLLSALAKSPYKKTKLGIHLSGINYGASVSNAYVDTGIPLLRIKDLKRNEISIDDVVYLPKNMNNISGNCFVKENDFLISRSGTIGVVAIVSKSIEDFAFGSYMIRFSLAENTEINREFLAYYLNSSLMQQLVERNRIGAIQGNITIPIIKNFPLVLPDTEKQAEITLHISEMRKKAKCLQIEATNILENVRQKVEQLILGQ